MTMRCAVLAVLMLLGASNVQGQQTSPQRRPRQQDLTPPRPRMTVGELKDLCAARDAAGSSACRYYILGASQGMGLGAGEAGGGSPLCIPGGIADDDVVAVVRRAMDRYLRAYPNELGKPAVSLVGAALMQAYPCGR